GSRADHDPTAEARSSPARRGELPPAHACATRAAERERNVAVGEHALRRRNGQARGANGDGTRESGAVRAHALPEARAVYGALCPDFGPGASAVHPPSAAASLQSR